MAVKKFQTLLLNMMLLFNMLLVMPIGWDKIVIIGRMVKDRIIIFDCSKVQGATRAGTRCTCENAGSILSDERGKLKCYGNVDKVIHANCRMEIISNRSHTYHIIDFEKECPGRTVLNSAVWNINTTGEAKGYWLYSNDIKNFLTFNTEGKLKVNVSKGLLNGLFLKLNLLCSSTDMIKCVMIKILGIRLYPLTQFKTSTIVPTPTTTAAMKPKSSATPTSRSETNIKQLISKNSTNTQRNKSIKPKSSSKNHIAIIVLLVTSVTMLISSILLFYLWRQRKRKVNLRQDNLKRASPQPLEPINLQPAFPEEKRNSTKSNIYETFGVGYTSVTIATSLKPGEQKAQYNELPHDYQEDKSVYTDLSNISHDKPEEREKKVFHSHLNIPREKAIYERFGAEYTSVTIAPSLKSGEHKAQYNQLPPDYQEVKPVYTDLSTTNPTCSEKLSHGKREKHKKKLFRSHLNIFRKKASVTLNPSPKLEEEKRQYNDLAESYRDFKPVYTDLSKDNPTFEEEHLYKELEEPKRTELPRASNVIKKRASLAFNPPNKSDKQIPQYSEIAPQYPDSLPLYANPNAVGGHVYRELEEPNKTDSPSSPSAIYDKPHCVVGNYCHRVRKLQ